MLEEILKLFAHTEVFIYVFMEIVTKIPTIQRVITRRPSWLDRAIFILLFGGFSIFGTYLGIQLPSGAISNIRDLAPMVAGLTAGPVIGLLVGLIGAIHRFFMGGFTCVPCALATVLAGLISGLVYYLNKRKIIGILPGMLLAVIVELIHGGLTLLIARPFTEAMIVLKTAIPAMMIANALGMAISIVVIHNTKEIREVLYNTPE